MGLDMYLKKMPRYKNTTVKQVYAIEQYLDWLKCKMEGGKYSSSTFNEWCGLDESELPSGEVIAYYTPFYITRYYTWDTEHKYGHSSIFEQVGYWRKANHIHQWFIDNIQNGEDDCDYHREVTMVDLEVLLHTCETVLESCVMMNGTVTNGCRGSANGWEPILEEGKVVIDPSIAKEMLPVQQGFFGSVK